MTDNQKYLIATAVITLVLGGIWYWITGKGEPEKQAPPSVSSESHSPHPASSDSSSPQTENPSDAPNKLTKKDMEEARKVAENFLRAYLNFSGDDPIKHIEEAKPFMTEKLYEKLAENPPRPTAEIQNQKFVEITGKHGIKGERDGVYEIEWAIQAVTEVENSKGKKREEEWTYIVTLTDEGGWKVKEVIQRGILD